MRTNIDLDEVLLREATRYSPAKTKKAVVHEALATYILVKSEEKKRETYQEQLQKFRKETSSHKIVSDSRKLIREDRDQR